jgi:hypothetical protein
VKVSIKLIGASGQISLGKEFAGRQVLVAEAAPGVWMIHTATVIPDNERWLYAPELAGELSRALEWASTNPPHPTDFIAVKRRLRHYKKSSGEQTAKGRAVTERSLADAIHHRFLAIGGAEIRVPLRDAMRTPKPAK